MSDPSCYICLGNAQVGDVLDEDLMNAWKRYYPNRAPHPETINLFRFGTGDRAFQTDLTAVGPFELVGDGPGGVVKQTGLVPKHIPPHVWTVAADYLDPYTVIELPRCTPGSRYNSAELVHEPTDSRILMHGFCYPWAHEGCVELLKFVLRDFENPARAFWAVTRKSNARNPGAIGIDNVFYGDMAESTHPRGQQGPDLIWAPDRLHPLANVKRAAGLDPLKDLLPLPVIRSLHSGTIDLECHAQYWLDPGGLWVFMRPDDFPLSAALTSSTFELAFLPPDFKQSTVGQSQLEHLPIRTLSNILARLEWLSVAQLLGASKTLRSRLIPHIDKIIWQTAPLWARPPPQICASSIPHFPYRSSPSSESWDTSYFFPDPDLSHSQPSSTELFPMNAKPPPIGSFYDNAWFSLFVTSPGFPWLRYAHEVALSASMRNRRRIMLICEQIRQMAATLEEAELGQHWPVGFAELHQKWGTIRSRSASPASLHDTSSSTSRQSPAVDAAEAAGKSKKKGKKKIKQLR
ncbi:hypothetical protein BKA62DRAFT_773704 [Auriculariales sp. MPI-PUGE-AT-0066]|nr:hypothetical protein BKA62DRAFT_773704 [Auriculariales sp. MPI-PUGE-AT-0066]